MLRSARERALEWFGIVAIVALVISTAWTGDDCYITLRTIDNFWNGYGLRWNVMERVQAYTHPLWMMIVGAAYGVTREGHFTTIAISMVCTLAFVAVVLTRIAESAGGRMIALALLAGSKSFIEFSTSGLENPLTHLLFALLLWQFWTNPPGVSRVWRVSLLAGLIGFNRLDSLAFAGPLWAYAVWTTRSWTAVGVALAGLLPLAAWEAFAVFYYGFPFPNTVYAKMPTGLSTDWRITQGFYYLRNSLIVDPITVPTIASALVLLVFSRHARSLIVAGALVLSLTFVVLVGGDHMTGRFLSAPFVVAVLAVCRRVPATAPKWAVLTASAIVTVWSASSPQSPWRVWPRPSGPLETVHGIQDDRLFWYQGTGLLPLLGGARVGDSPLAFRGKAWRPLPRVELFGAIGIAGFYAGPGAHIIDTFALSDPLLARLPMKANLGPGHYERAIPEGYEKTAERCLTIVFPRTAVRPPSVSCYGSPDRVNAIKDPEIAALYDQLALITQGSLFDRRRLRAIVTVNFERRLR